MANIRGYIEEAFNELVNKVTWPSWPELQNSAVVVMVASLIIGFAIYIMDSSFGNLLEIVYEIFKS